MYKSLRISINLFPSYKLAKYVKETGPLNKGISLIWKYVNRVRKLRHADSGGEGRVCKLKVGTPALLTNMSKRHEITVYQKLFTFYMKSNNYLSDDLFYFVLFKSTTSTCLHV